MVKATLARNKVSATLFAPPFNAYYFSMNQRLLVFDEVNPSKNVDVSTYEVEVAIPNSPILATSGYYLLFVVYQEVRSHGGWVQFLLFSTTLL